MDPDMAVTHHPRHPLLVLLFLLAWTPQALSTVTSTTSVTAQAQGATTTSVPVNIIIEDIVPKSVITFFGLGLFVLIGMAVAKVVDRFHDKVELRDDASDISEHTRDLLKARFALFAFSPAKLQSEAEQKVRDLARARKFGRMWMVRAAMSRRKKRDMAKAAILNVVNETTPTATGSARIETSTPVPSMDEAGTASTPRVVTSSAAGASTADAGSTNVRSAAAADKPKVTIVSYKSKDDASAVDSKKTEDHNAAAVLAGKTAKRNLDFIAIDIQNLDDSTETREGSTIPSTPRNTYIDFREVSEDVTIPVRVSTDDTPRPRRTMTLDHIPPPKVAYADSEFGSDTSFKQSVTTQVVTPAAAHATSGGIRSRTSEGLEITSLSRENSFESIYNTNSSKTVNKSKSQTPTSVYDAARPKTPGAKSAAAKRDSRPLTSRPMTGRVTSSRPLTAGRAQAITQGGRGNRAVTARRGR